MDEDWEGKSPRAIGARLRLVREVLGQTQAEFARECGIAAPTYNEFEKGVTRPGIDKARQIKKAAHLTLDFIYDGEIDSLRHDLARSIVALRQTRESLVKTPKYFKLSRKHSH